MYSQVNEPQNMFCRYLGYIKDLFSVEYSRDIGKKQLEITTYHHFNNYFNKIEGDVLRFFMSMIFFFLLYTHYIDYLDQAVGNDEQTVELSDILMFFTGTTHIPPGGFQTQPTLSFLHNHNDKLATSSTCSLTLRVPVHSNSWEDFSAMMTFSILGSEGFHNT